MGGLGQPPPWQTVHAMGASPWLCMRCTLQWRSSWIGRPQLQSRGSGHSTGTLCSDQGPCVLTWPISGLIQMTSISRQVHVTTWNPSKQQDVIMRALGWWVTCTAGMYVRGHSGGTLTRSITRCRYLADLFG